MLFSRLQLALSLACLFVFASCCFGAEAQSRNASTPSSAPQFPDLFGTWLANQNLTECESATRCDGLWEFNNSVNGKAFWTLRSISADLKVTKITPTTIELWSVSDFSEAINAHYVGTLKDGIIEGEAIWTKRDTGQHWQGHWYASVNPAALQAKLGTKITAPKAPAAPVESQVNPVNGRSSVGQGTGPRRAMRLCSQAGCQTLTWADGVYEGRSDGNDNVTTNFTVTRWDASSIELTGIVLNPDGNNNYITGIFTGKLSPDGISIQNGMDQWRAGQAAGTIPYTLKWSPNEPLVPNLAPFTAKLPAEMKLCMDPCFRLKLNAGRYDAFSTTGERPEKVAAFSVASFSPHSVYMNFLQKDGSRAILVGSIKNNAIVDGKVIWLNAYNGNFGTFEAMWGAEVQSHFKTEEALQPEPCKVTASGPVVKVAPEVMEVRLVRRVAVIYPSGVLRMARIQGLIYLDAVISPCGTVTSATSVDDGPLACPGFCTK